MSRSPGVTLCSVSFRSREYLIQNRFLTARLNPKEDIKWLVIENTHSGESPNMSGVDGFDVVRGRPCGLQATFVGSYHHAQALNEAVRLIKTRYVAILDPDFFVLRPQWIQDIQQQMMQQRQAFFGAPYFPDKWYKYRYFPCAIFLWVDLDQVSPEDLDFTPEMAQAKRLVGLGLRQLTRSLFTVPQGVNRHQLIEAIEQRLFARQLKNPTGRVGRFVSPDVGIRLYRRYARDWTKRAQCLVPSWANPLYRASVGLRGKCVNVLLRLLVPDRLLREPSRRGYTSTAAFRDFGYQDLASKGWEEYFWNKRPFAFHLRGVSQGLKSVDAEELTAVLCALNSKG